MVKDKEYERLRELKEKLDYYSYLYYTLDRPLLRIMSMTCSTVSWRRLKGRIPNGLRLIRLHNG